MTDTVLLVLGNQLFEPARLPAADGLRVFMAEDLGLCTYVRHHQQKIALFLTAMREYRAELLKRGYDVTYRTLDDDEADEPIECRLRQFMEVCGTRRLCHFEIEDHFLERRIDALVEEHSLERCVLRSPMFLCSRDAFDEYLDASGKPFMASFYKRQRHTLGLLMNGDEPLGGRYSFDSENRRKLPKDLVLPDLPNVARSRHADAVIALVRERFEDHPGDARDLWLPTTRRSALAWLRRFLEERLECFGPYQDALSGRSATTFHSVLTPMLNMGLITPDEVVERALETADEREIPLNSLEGFVRQVVGWREFVRGIYHRYDAEQSRRNFFGHERRLTDHWYEGTTGIVPLDRAIERVVRLGWNHHIERLMVTANLMTLCEIEPREAHRWFMEMYVDSSDWVMGPNVYGMGLYSDGGIFATKPYICGSNYLLRMSDDKRGDWCDVVDGLYWRFIDRHRSFFAGNPRLALMPKALDRLDEARRERLFERAAEFLERCTDGP